MGMLLHRRALEQANQTVKNPAEVTKLHNITPTHEAVEAHSEDDDILLESNTAETALEAPRTAPVVRRGRPARKA